MTITTWRIYKPQHASAAFTGQGARLHGGRWNSKGTSVIYTAQSISLAALEILVHLQSSSVLAHYRLRSATFDASLVKHMPINQLPKNWRRNPVPVSAQQIGDQWIAAAESAVLQLPSVTIPAESIFLLNPDHPDFKHIRLGAEEAFAFDSRLAR